MAFDNVTLFDVTDWTSAPKTSSAQTGGLGKFITHLYVDWDEGNGTVTDIDMRLYAQDPLDASDIYIVGQGAPNTNAFAFLNYDLNAAGGTLKKWIAVGADPSAENNNGYIMIPTDQWKMQIDVAGGGTTTSIKVIAQLSDGMS